VGDKSNCSVICTLFKIAFLGKWDERGERPFLWPLTSFPDRRRATAKIIKKVILYTQHHVDFQAM